MLKKNLFSLIIPLLILIFRPFDIDLSQSIILASLTFTIIVWVTRSLNRTYMSIFLLAIFVVFGNTPLEKIFSFPLSENFFLILFSFLFSQGIANSNLGEKLLQPILYKYTKNIKGLLLSMVLFPLLLIFIIPQPFSRIIILALIYSEYFDKIEIKKDLKGILMFGIFAFTIIINILFKRGDIILAAGVLSLTNLSLSEFQWMKYMTLPGLAMVFTEVTLFYYVFKKDLKNYCQNVYIKEDILLDKRDWMNLAIIIFTTLMWATETIHHISGTIIVILGCILFYSVRILKKEDLKSMDIKLMIFLTAAFSIGSVMNASGVAQKIFASFTDFFPDTFSLKYVLLVMVSSISLHMILGSNVTSLSVVIPSLLALSSGIVRIEILMFIVLISIVSHFILPFHNVVLVVGEGKGYFTSKPVIKFGLYLTVLTFLAVFLFFLPYWNLMGLV